MSRHTLISLVLAVLTMGISFGCERTPADVEKWRDAKRGTEKMSKWIRSSKEPMDVRVRSLEVLIEEHQASLLGSTLEKVDDTSSMQTLIDAGVTKIQSMWNEQDFPKMKEGEKQGKVKVSESAAIKAKDAAYHLQPFASGKNKAKLESILAEWLSDDWRLRNKLGNTTLGQLVPRSGSKGVNNALKWLEKTEKPSEVAGILRNKAGEKTKGKIADVLVERAERQHPDLSSSLQNAILQTEHEAVVPYLKKVIDQPNNVPARFNDGARQALINIQGERAAPFLTEIIGKHEGNLRWASVNDLIKLRGKSGILSSMSALPLDKETYDYPDQPDKNFKKDAEWFSTFVVGEMINAEVSTVSNTLIQALESERWPARALALMCVKRAHVCATKPEACGDEDAKENLISSSRDELQDAIESLKGSDESLPAWGDDYKTIGQLAGEAAEMLTTS